MNRWLLATVTALVAGIGVALLAGAILEPTGTTIGFWGTVWGIVATVAAFGATSTLLARNRTMSKTGRATLASVLGLLALAVTWWVVMWGVSPLTLEGAWMYPTAILAGLGCVALLRTFRSS